MSLADQYRKLRYTLQFPESLQFYRKHGTIDPYGWITFTDGSRYNIDNGHTINPGDIIV